MSAPVRVVVADDSPLMRRVLANSLRRGGVEVVGTAADGDEALAVCERERPDALTLDLAMPGLDGLGVLRALQAPRVHELPVVVVSAFSPAAGARAVDALAEGAFDLVAKPGLGENFATFASGLIEKVKLAAASRRRGRSGSAGAVTQPAAPAKPTPAPGNSVSSATGRAVVIATSTGGPKALSEVLPALPCPLGLGTLIVQHMPPGFTQALAARLNSRCRLTVSEARALEQPHPTRALIAPGGQHLRLSSEGRTLLSDDAELGGLRPRADLLIEDAARVWGERLLLVVLTGMGSDALAGARAVRRHGGQVLAESRDSAVVYGMPRAVIEARLADEVLPLSQMAAAITAEAGS